MLYRKLKFDQSFIPKYITTIIPETRQQETGRNLRNAHTHTLPPNRTSLFKKSFIPDTARLWNSLPMEFHSITSSKTFKTALTELLSAPKPTHYYELGTVKGNRLHTRLRLGMSDLHAHQYQILKATTPHCSCGHRLENTKHFLLNCINHKQHRTHMIHNITQILHKDFSSLPAFIQLDVLLNGSDLTVTEAGKVAAEVQSFLLKTNRFTS